MAMRELAERLLEALPDNHELTDADTAMIGALVTDRGPSGLSWVTRGGQLLSITVAGENVQTVADLRKALATLPPPSEKNGSKLGEAIADAILRVVNPIRRELVVTHVRLSTLIDMLEERGEKLGAEYTRRWYANYERDGDALWDLVCDDSEEGEPQFREQHADWIANQDEVRRRRFGADDELLKAEWIGVQDRLRQKHEEKPPTS